MGKMKKNGAKVQSKGQSLSDSLVLAIKETSLFRLDEKAHVTILNLQSGLSYEVSGAAAYVWFLLDGSRSFGEVVEEAEAQLGPKSAGYIRSFVSDVFEKNLVEAVKARKKPQYKMNPVKAHIKSVKGKKGLQQKSLKIQEVSAGSGGFLGSGTGGCLTGGRSGGGTSNCMSTSMCGCISSATGS